MTNQNNISNAAGPERKAINWRLPAVDYFPIVEGIPCPLTHVGLVAHIVSMLGSDGRPNGFVEVTFEWPSGLAA